ncbi:MAG: DUF4872 domain-containing protein [Dehalococcoidia bacterium]|nr:DUF4872 domain-containing protein [Dehalococcoidia bacterium]
MYPHLVFGYEPDRDLVFIADRSRAPLTITTGELAQARGRVKKTNYRVTTLDLPNTDKLAGAVRQGLHDCVALYTERPPKGSPDNFGILAFKRWAEVLTRPKARLSWHTQFPMGLPLYAGLTSAYHPIMIDGKEGGAERGLFADCLDAAAVLLALPALTEVAAQFRQAAERWNTLAEALLLDAVPLLAETRHLLWERHRRFLAAGHDRAFDQGVTQRLAAVRATLGGDFPLAPGAAGELLAHVGDLVTEIGVYEASAVTDLRQILDGEGFHE